MLKSPRPATWRRRYIFAMVLGLAFALSALPAVLQLQTDRVNAQIGQSKIPPGDFERRIRDYLLNNPEVIVEAMQRYEAQQRADQAKAARKLIVARADELLRDSATPVAGNPDGDVSLVEFFNYNCPYCRRVSPDMIKLEASDLKLRIVYKEFPILGPNSTFPAKAALAAHRQGKYVELHRALMKGRGTVTRESILRTAKKLGLDTKQLEKDMEDPEIDTALKRNIALANALGINGTPAFVIGKEIVPGAIDFKALQQLVAKARRKE